MGLVLQINAIPLFCSVFMHICVYNFIINAVYVCLQWRIDSAATSTYEIGNPPDHRGQACMKRHGVSMRHVARQVRRGPDQHSTLEPCSLCVCYSGLQTLVPPQIGILAAFLMPVVWPASGNMAQRQITGHNRYCRCGILCVHMLSTLFCNTEVSRFPLIYARFPVNQN